MDYDITKAIKGYNRFINTEIVQKDYDKFNILEFVAKIQDKLSNNSVDFIASRIDKNGSIDENFINIKSIYTDVLSNNLFYLEINYKNFKYPQFKLSSLDKITDYETNIFSVQRNELGNYINFDKSFLETELDIKFLIHEKIVKNNALEIYFNYMNWE